MLVRKLLISMRKLSMTPRRTTMQFIMPPSHYIDTVSQRLGIVDLKTCTPHPPLTTRLTTLT